MRSALVGFLGFAWVNACGKLFTRAIAASACLGKRNLRISTERQALFFTVDAVLENPSLAAGRRYQ